MYQILHRKMDHPNIWTIEYAVPKHIRKKDLVVMGEELFDKRKEGITLETFTRRDQIGKSRAQRILKGGVQKHLFFTPRRIIHRGIIRRVGIML